MKKTEKFTFVGDMERTDVERICKYMKEQLGNQEYRKIREFFYHVCVDDFDYKVLVTRRAYLLYRIFFAIFEHIEEERLNNQEHFRPKGNVYNSHSICVLREKISPDKDSCLIVDDIIVNGRAISETFKKICEVGINAEKIDIWCLLCCSSAKCISKEAKKQLKTYRLVEVDKWKMISESLTDIILNFEWGYTSYLSTYKIKFNCENLILKDEIKKYINNEIGKSVIKNKEFKDNVIQNYIKYFDSKWNIIDENNGVFELDDLHIDCLRIYIYEDSILLIPYMFLASVKSEDVYNLGVKILRDYQINKIPKVFYKLKDGEQLELAPLFLKWIINTCGRKLVEEFLDTIDSNATHIIEYLDCEATYNFDIKTEVNIDSNFTTNIIKCNDTIPESFNDYVNCIREATEIVLQKFDKNRNEIANDFSWIHEIITNYIILERASDHKKVSGKEFSYMGIRVSDAVSAIWDSLIKNSLTNNNSDFYLTITKVVLSEFINIWDRGESSYDLKLIKCKNYEIISGLTRHGEQSFKTIYRLYDDIYSYYFLFTRMTLETGTYKLREFKKELMSHLKNKSREIDSFAHHIESSNDYSSDVFLIEPNKLIGLDFVNNYIYEHYTP